MQLVATAAAQALVDRLSNQQGVQKILQDRMLAGGLKLHGNGLGAIRAGNYSVEIGDLARGGKSPEMLVYTQKIRNLLTEKFQTFSGKVEMVVEIRNSADRLDGLQQDTQAYTEAVMQALDASRGEWQDGFYYSGRYDVEFEPVKHGGRNYSQTATVSLELEVNIP